MSSLSFKERMRIGYGLAVNEMVSTKSSIKKPGRTNRRRVAFQKHKRRPHIDYKNADFSEESTSEETEEEMVSTKSSIKGPGTTNRPGVDYNNLSAEISTSKRKPEQETKESLIKGPSTTNRPGVDYNNLCTEKSTSKRKPEQETEETPQSRKNKGLDGSLVGARIKVWWQGDKVFYKGVVEAYDSVTKIHKVAYDDGEEEVLLLKNENWKFISEETNTLKKFHKKGSPIHYNMEKLYEGIIATGDLNFTSTEKPRRFPPSPTEHDPGVGVKPFSADLEGQRLSKDPINLDEEEHTTLCYSGQKEAGYGEKRKQSQVFGVQQEYVDFRKRQTRTSEDDLDRKTKPTDDYSIKNCLAVLESIEELSDAEKAKAIRILKCDQNREILLSLKNPTVRLLWIKGEIAP